MDNSKKDNMFYKLLITIAILIPMVVGISYAYFLTNIKGGNTTISGTATTSDFTLDLITDNSGYIAATDLIPIKEVYIENRAAKGMFSVSTINETGNQNVNPIAFNISLTDLTITNGLRDAVNNSFKWSITCENCSDTSNDKSGSFSALTNLVPASSTSTNGITTYKYNNYALADNYQLIICPSTTQTYTLRIWIDWLDDVEQSSILNQTFSAKVAIEGQQAFNSTNQCGS